MSVSNADAEMDIELRNCFLEEASDLVRLLEQSVLQLAKEAQPSDLLSQLFRAAHNLKGSSAAVGFDSLSRLTHKLESLFLAMREGRVLIEPQVIQLLLLCVDHLGQALNTLRENPKADVADPTLISRMEEASSGTASTCDKCIDSQNAPSSSATSAHASPSADHEDSDHSHGPGAPPSAPASAPSSPAARSSNAQESLRVPLGKIEQLLNDVGELVILQTVMSQNQKSLESMFLRKTVLQMEKIIRNVQSNSMSLRMVSMKALFQRLERIVHDSSAELKKQVALVTIGGDQELDKTMLEQITDPLVHMIRNSVDHGVEGPEERMKAGKAPQGTITIRAFQRGGQIVIEVSDDGQGLNTERILAKAREKGLVKPEQPLSTPEIHKLIFMNGFSTKQEVTSLSGRGVGMDVVRTNIEAMQGSVEIDSELGRGTTMRLVLPVTLAIVDAAVIQVGGEKYVTPMAQILEYYRPRLEELRSLKEKAEMLQIRGKMIPLIRLEKLLGGKGGSLGQLSTGATVLIVQSPRAGQVGVLVDRVLRLQQVVIKKLSREIQSMPGIMGGAILGDGRVAMILDLYDWVDRAVDVQDPKARREKAG